MIEKIKNVLIIGDSYSVKSRPHWPCHWLEMLEAKYSWNVINKSWFGVGPSYNILKFFENQEPFDLCIFAWSEASRCLYHKDVKDLNHGTAINKAWRGSPEHNHIYDAAKLYFENLMHWPMVDIHNLSLLKSFDNYISKKYSDKQFWHFYSFPAYHNDSTNVSLQSIPYKFKTGVTMFPSLNYYSNIDPFKPETLANDWRDGHMSPSVHETVRNKLNDFISQNITSGLYSLEDIDRNKIKIGIKL